MKTNLTASFYDMIDSKIENLEDKINDIKNIDLPAYKSYLEGKIEGLKFARDILIIIMGEE